MMTARPCSSMLAPKSMVFFPVELKAVSRAPLVVYRATAKSKLAEGLVSPATMILSPESKPMPKA